MTIEAIEDGVNVNIQVNGEAQTGTFQIQLNNGGWKDVLWEDIGNFNEYDLIVAANPNKNIMSKGDVLRFRNIDKWSNGDVYSQLKITDANAKVYGKLTDSLTHELAASKQQFKLANMFEDSSTFVDAAEFNLTDGIALADYCYSSMFSGCTSLTAAPALPAMTLVIYCYAYMFQGCTSLVNAPELPATTLADSCYCYMFNGCTKIAELHYPASIESDSTFTSIPGSPKFDATNATVHYDL